MRFFSKLFIYIILLFISILFSFSQEAPSLYVNGRYLYTPCNEKVILRGVNKMIIWTNDLQLRKTAYGEIRKTGANCVRIVWLANPSLNEADSGPDGLDRTIQDCIDNQMIPMIELHDATGNWNGLQTCVNYLMSQDVLQVIKKHEKYLLVNIANECGDDLVTDEQFKSGYKSAISQLRNAGIICPLVIDASDWGKNLGQLRNTGQYLLDEDIMHNLIFSVHMYWAISDGADANYITSEIDASVLSGIPFIIGEFAYKFNRSKECTYETDYKTIIKLCSENEIGWLAWEWGPGNEYADPTCEIMNMTTDCYFDNLKDNWAKEIAITSEYSINKTSITSKYIMNGGKCIIDGIEINENESISISAVPNPFTEYTELKLKLNHSAKVSVMVYNLLGDLIYINDMGILPEGTSYSKISNNLLGQSGIYNCFIEIDGIRKSIKLIQL